MKPILGMIVVAALAFGAAVPASAQTPGLQLTMKDGLVTIIARDVALRDLLKEWSRVGDTQIINIDKLTSPRITIQLVNTTERAALDILLRSAAGYIAASRRGDQPGMTTYDRITILATSSRPAPMNAGNAPAMATPANAPVRGGEYIPDTAQAADAVQEEAPQAAEYQPAGAPFGSVQPEQQGEATPVDLNSMFQAAPQQTVAPPPQSGVPVTLPPAIQGRYTYPLPSGGRIGGQF
jgi:hypothetical protein